jgi:hypothetical protein
LTRDDRNPASTEAPPAAPALPGVYASIRFRGDGNKKGDGKPIRRLAITSILKQNTLCFALPLRSFYRRGAPRRLTRNDPFRRFFGFSRLTMESVAAGETVTRGWSSHSSFCERVLTLQVRPATPECFAALVLQRRTAIERARKWR